MKSTWLDTCNCQHNKCYFYRERLDLMGQFLKMTNPGCWRWQPLPTFPDELLASSDSNNQRIWDLGMKKQDTSSWCCVLLKRRQVISPGIIDDEALHFFKILCQLQKEVATAVYSSHLMRLLIFLSTFENVIGYCKPVI